MKQAKEAEEARKRQDAKPVAVKPEKAPRPPKKEKAEKPEKAEVTRRNPLPSEVSRLIFSLSLSLFTQGPKRTKNASGAPVAPAQQQPAAVPPPAPVKQEIPPSHELVHKQTAKKSPDPTTSMIYSFATAQIQSHINSLAKVLLFDSSIHN